MSLLESLQKDMIAAMKAKDKVKLGTIRMLKAAVVNEQIEVGHDLSSDEEIAVLSRELKQRKDSLEEFKNAGRDEAVQNLKNEIKVVESYLPEQLSEDEVKTIVQETIDQVGATSKADFGKVMGAVMPKLKGKADGKLVEYATQQKPLMIGKPEKIIMEMALKRVGLTTADAVMVGDNYHTDIQAAINVGMDSLLVYTGLSRPAEVEQEEIQPTYTVATLDDWQID